MHGLTPHLDDFILLRYTAGELEDPERQSATQHLKDCPDCSHLLVEVRRLNTQLQVLAVEDPAVFADPEAFELPADDTFRKRPTPLRPPRDRSLRAERLVESAVEASQRGAEGRDRLLGTVGDSKRVRALLGDLGLATPADRFCLLYALQEAGQRISESPAHMRRFAEEALERLRRRGENDADPVAEKMVPRVLLLGQVHKLAGQACNWLGDYDIAQAHFAVAYASFARGNDEIGLAQVEVLESQRRYFVGKGREALVLARRAATTFGAYGLDDSQARARGAEGMALFCLGRTEAALEAYRAALAVFEQQSLWSNYVGMLKNVAVCLVNLGRLDEARRVYAQALRRLSRERHRSFLAFIRHGLAEVLFAAAHYREAARSVAQARRLYDQDGLKANAMTAWLFEVESWARSGDVARARETLGAFSRSLAADASLDPSVALQIEKALSGLDSDFGNITDLRRQAEAVLPPSWRGMSA